MNKDCGPLIGGVVLVSSYSATYVSIDLSPHLKTRGSYYEISGPALRPIGFRELQDYGRTALRDALATNDRAQTSGYDPENSPEGKKPPHRTVLSRARTEYFRDGLKGVVRSVSTFGSTSGKLVSNRKPDAHHREPSTIPET